MKIGVKEISFKMNEIENKKNELINEMRMKMKVRAGKI